MDREPRSSIAFMLIQEHLAKGGSIKFASADTSIPLDRQDLATSIQKCSEALMELTSSASDAELPKIREIISRLQLEISDLSDL